MKKIDNFIYQIRENKYIHYLIILIIGIILSIPLSNIQLEFTHDGIIHLIRICGTYNITQIKEFPPLITPNFCNNWGYAINLFYNPIVTYIPFLIKYFTSTYAIALKIFASVCIILSGITMYKFVYTVTNKRSISLFASLIYLMVPYKLFDVYIRFAIGEFASFVFLPILFTGVYNLFNSDGTKHYYIAIGSILLLLTHTITTFYSALICLIYLLFNIKKLKQKEIIKKIIINVIFIILITSFFTIPILEAKIITDYIIFDNTIMVTNPNNVYNNTLKLHDILFNKKEGLNKDCEKPMNFMIGIPILFFMSITLFTFKKISRNYKDFYILSCIFSLVSLFMSTKYCPWVLFPNILCKIQFPWRMLVFFSFFISFIVGVNFYIFIKTFFKQNISRLLSSILLIVLIVIYTLSILIQYKSTNKIADIEAEKYYNNNNNIHYMSINRDYFPYKAFVVKDTYLLNRTDKTSILYGTATIIKEEKIDLTDTIYLSNISKNTILEFPFLYYPGYKITLEINGKYIKLDSVESPNGFVSCTIEEPLDDATIFITYKGTVLTYASYILSFISLIIFIIYIYHTSN